MILNIKDQVFLTLKIDGQEVNGIFIKDLTLSEGNGTYAPTMRLEADDPTSLLSTSKALSEGNKIEVLIAKAMGDPEAKPRKYRIFGPTRDNNSYNPNLRLIGVLDAPLYFTRSSRESFTGTTDTVLTKLAEICGFKYDGPPNGRALNDSQIWLDVCTSRARFAYQVTRHAYMDDKSCMESVVTSTHDLVYRNLMDEINTPLGNIKYMFAHSALPSTDGRIQYLVKEARDRSTSGVMSHWVNYGSTRCKNDIDGYQKDRTKIDVKAPSPYLAINKEVSDMIERTRFDYAAIDCTNTHPEYQNALYQNAKLLALFTETMSLLINEVTNVKLLDPVIYRQADADPNVKVRNEDVYLVVGKTIVVRGGVHYAERIQLSRISLEMKGTAPLKSSLDDNSFGGNDVGSVNSVVAPPSIDLAQAGTVFSSGMNMVSSVMAPLTSITQSLSSLSSLASKLSLPAGALASVQRLLSAGSVPEIASALGNLSPQLSGLLGSVTQAQGSYMNVAAQLDSIVRQLSSMPKSVSMAALSQPGGVTSAIGSAVQTLSVLGAATNTANNIVQVLPASLRDSEAVRTITATTSAMSGKLNETAATASQIWNAAVGIASGQNAPVLQQAARTTDLFDRLTRLLDSSLNAGTQGPGTTGTTGTTPASQTILSGASTVANGMSSAISSGSALAQTYQQLVAQKKSPSEILRILALMLVQAEMLKAQTKPIWMTAADFIRTFDSVEQSVETLDAASTQNT